MVEPVADEFLRSPTPRPSRSTSSIRVDVAVDQRDSPSDESRGGTSHLYEISCSILHSPEDSHVSDTNEKVGESPYSMPGDGRSRDPMSSGSSRRQSYNKPRRPPPHPTVQTAPSHFASPDHLSPQRPSPIYPSSAQYQRPGFFGQYTMSQQPPPMGMTPSSAYPYPHGYQGLSDGSMMPQNIHASYQSMIPSPGAVYPFQRHSSESGSSAYSTPPLYSHPPSHNSTSPSMSPQSSASQNATPPYANTGQFHSLRYPSPMSTSPYPYPTQSFPSSPMYQSQYSPYPQHYPTPSDAEGQGIWWYLPHASVPSHNNSSPYPTPYSINYSPVRQEMEYSSPGGAPATQMYPISPMPALPHTGRDLPSASSASPAAPTSSSPIPDATSSKSIVERPASTTRRSYHPNPPAYRSEWVMWAGNVPSDATHDELWRFFNQAPAQNAPDDNWTSGVLSIFLIARSNCAFVNYDLEAQLQSAISRFNGVSLRSHDPRCPRLLCRVRKKDDDLKAGVGGQRGVGMHTKWLKDQREKRKGKGTPVDQSDQSDFDESNSSAVSLSSGDEGRSRIPHRSSGNSSGSFASTNSSLLTRYFPKRYFILKSLSQYDLDLSVQKGLWATQKHNEGILDQAYRTSKEIYLIFGVNKSGEFYGYAKMAGPVKQGEHRVSWATRTDSSASSRSSLSPITGRAAVYSDAIPEEPASPSRVFGDVNSSSPPAHTYFPSHMVKESPLPVSSIGDQPPAGQPGESMPLLMSKAGAQSAPAELGRKHHQMSIQTPSMMYSLDNRSKAKLGSARPTTLPASNSVDEEFYLDAAAPLRAMKHLSSDEKINEELFNLKLVEERGDEDDGKEDAASAKGDGTSERDETWGDSFKVQWICTDRLPFFRTRHLRNPWNHDREIKVSRDGTELEPSVGQQLVDEWERLAAEARELQSAPELTTVNTEAGSKPNTPGGSRRPGPTSRVAPSASRIGRGAVESPSLLRS